MRWRRLSSLANFFLSSLLPPFLPSSLIRPPAATLILPSHSAAAQSPALSLRDSFLFYRVGEATSDKRRARCASQASDSSKLCENEQQYNSWKIASEEGWCLKIIDHFLGFCIGSRPQVCTVLVEPA